MPFGSVRLIPGVNVERTPTLLEAGVSTSQGIRYKDSLIQKIGGFSKFYVSAIPGVPRDLHAWQDLNGGTHLLAGTTRSLSVITGMSLSDVTPQQLTSNPSVSVSVSTASFSATITDTNLSSPLSINDSLMVNTPISVGGTIVTGVYPVQTVIGTTSFTINLATAAVTSVTNGGSVPLFSTTINSPLVNALLTAHGLSTTQMHGVTFQATTTLNGITIYGSYPVSTIDANNFQFSAEVQANATGTALMNSGNAQYIYNIVNGPSATGAGYGTGGYGSGGYGSGVTITTQTGTLITATDWTSDNWGEISLSVPRGGAVYTFDPTIGNLNASPVVTAPPFNNGLFISSNLQILFCWGTTANNIVGQAIDTMLIKWSDQGDYTQFTPSTTNQAGSFRIPSGSVIRGGMSVQNQNLFWTDLDLWAANYAGFPLVFGFNKIGSGAGLISSHAAQQLRNNVYWMGPTNFYSFSSNGVSVLPCPMWDFVYQNLNTAYSQNVRAMPNTPFNEAGWLFPSKNSTTGECDSYVKMNITEPGMPWDGGTIARSAWIDQTILGNPISAAPTGFIYQQETTNDADGTALMSSFTTGYFYIAEGEDFSFVDQIIPDFKWTLFTGGASAQIQMTFNVLNYPGDTPTTYGPYIVNSTTEYLSVRMRGRLMSITIASNDVGSFWRIGLIKYRWSPAGRR